MFLGLLRLACARLLWNRYRTPASSSADNAARKNGTTDSDAAFEAQLSQLKTQERADMRAVLTPDQQAAFDANVTKAAKRK